MTLTDSIQQITDIIYKNNARLISFSEVSHFSKTSGEIHYKIIKKLLADPRNNINYSCSENVAFTTSSLMDDYVTAKTDIYPTSIHTYGLIERKTYELIRKYNMTNPTKMIHIVGIEPETIADAIIPISNPSKKLVEYYTQFKKLTKQTWNPFGEASIPSGLSGKERKAALLLRNSITKNRFEIMYKHLLTFTRKGITVYIGYHVNHNEASIFNKKYGSKFISFGLAAKKIQHPKIINIPYYFSEYEANKLEINKLLNYGNLYNIPLHKQYIDKYIKPTLLEEKSKNYQLINTSKSKEHIRYYGVYIIKWKDNPHYQNANVYDYILIIPDSKAKLVLY